jgi:hypothetical protein
MPSNLTAPKTLWSTASSVLRSYRFKFWIIAFQPDGSKNTVEGTASSVPRSCRFKF